MYSIQDPASLPSIRSHYYHDYIQSHGIRICARRGVTGLSRLCACAQEVECAAECTVFDHSSGYYFRIDFPWLY